FVKVHAGRSAAQRADVVEQAAETTEKFIGERPAYGAASVRVTASDWIHVHSSSWKAQTAISSPLPQAYNLSLLISSLLRYTCGTAGRPTVCPPVRGVTSEDRKSTRLNSSHVSISY